MQRFHLHLPKAQVKWFSFVADISTMDSPFSYLQMPSVNNDSKSTDNTEQERQSIQTHNCKEHILLHPDVFIFNGRCWESVFKRKFYTYILWVIKLKIKLNNYQEYNGILMVWYNAVKYKTWPNFTCLESKRFWQLQKTCNMLRVERFFPRSCFCPCNTLT